MDILACNWETVVRTHTWIEKFGQLMATCRRKISLLQKQDQFGYPIKKWDFPEIIYTDIQKQANKQKP